MAQPEIDVAFTISTDSKKLTIYDDTKDWGVDGITRDSIDSTLIEIYTTQEKEVEDLISKYDSTDFLLTENIIEIIIAEDAGFFELDSEQLLDGIYYYKLTYNSTAVVDPIVKEGIFYSTRIVEGNINSDLLDFISGVQAFNRKLDFGAIEEIRRRDNILFAVESAQFFSETENVKTLLTFLQRLE